jgi:LmbE family N-acetylglucosaminyl deacetylase
MVEGRRVPLPVWSTLRGVDGVLRFQIGDLERLLLIGAHSDDIEIGCAGTLLRLLSERPRIAVRWVVLSALGEREQEAKASAEALLAGAEADIAIESFRDGFLPYDGCLVKEYFEGLKQRIQPDLILTHFGRDAHQDHRLVSELTWNTFRDHPILEFEIPKYDGDLGTPNLFVALDEAHVVQKVEHLLRYFPSQVGRRWFTADLFSSVMRIRGMECNAASGYAEAFYARKVVI